MKAVLASYTLSLAVFIPISGWMADRFGTRRVFSSAIGIFTLGSLLCGVSNNIHVLVACRVLQGCGGAMMVPVGRLTLVRTFAKSELIRAMSFVAIPGLVGPMLGPIAGGLIVGYLQWRVIFFINVPIGLLGLYVVYRHLPDYREKRTHPLDIVGLILFGSGIGLLSYVLEVFGEHTLSWPVILGLLAIFRGASRGLWVAGDPHDVPSPPAGPVSRPDFSRGGQRQFFSPAWASAAFRFFSRSSIRWALIYPDSIRPSHGTPGGGRHEPQDHDAKHSQIPGLSPGPGLQYPDSRPAHHAVRDDWRGHAAVARRGGNCSSMGSSPRSNTPA